MAAADHVQIRERLDDGRAELPVRPRDQNPHVRPLLAQHEVAKQKPVDPPAEPVDPQPAVVEPGKTEEETADEGDDDSDEPGTEE